MEEEGVADRRARPVSGRERGGEVGARVLGRLGPSRPKTRGEGIDGWFSFLFLTYFQKHLQFEF